MTRPDWRTCNWTISNNFIKEINNICNVEIDNTPALYKRVHRNMYDELYSMSRKDLIKLLYNQKKILKINQNKLKRLRHAIRNNE
jgi:hypothetical protein